MNCPYCGKPMRRGYVQGARGVIFSEWEKVLFITTSTQNLDGSVTCDAYGVIS